MPRKVEVFQARQPHFTPKLACEQAPRGEREQERVEDPFLPREEPASRLHQNMIAGNPCR